MFVLADYVAHVSKDGRVQSVETHCRNVARMAREFADEFGRGDSAYRAGLFHDVGKTSSEFQRRILNDGPRCDHSTAGAFELWRANDVLGSFVVSGHHGGLPNLGSKADDVSASTLYGRVARARKRLVPRYVGFGESVSTVPSVRPGFDSAMLTRMLYSAVVDADFLDTEAFMNAAGRLFSYASIDELCDAFRVKVGEWANPTEDINRVRQEILENCLAKSVLDRGLYSLTVPTGGGKTTASLGFALEHAKRHGMRRIIYVIPYTSIIEQTADVFRNALGRENVLEHHSGYEGSGDADERKLEEFASENWDVPVVVTTAVQFFESFFSNKPSGCRRLHNVANSVIVFDETQLLPLEHLTPCTRVIEELVRNYRCTALLCTATCPSLDRFFKKVPIVELQSNKNELYEKLRRTHFEILPGKRSESDLAEFMAKHEQVLCVVNTRQAAVEIFERLPPEGRYHLSTLMCSAHRREVLAEIKARLLAGEVVRVVSTSLIEAGVDVDFRVVMREIAGLDSLIQAAGRENRKGEYSADESPVYIFERDGSVPSALNQQIGAYRHVLSRGLDLDSLDAIAEYFDKLYSTFGSERTDVCRAVDAFEKCRPCPWPFKTVADDFRFIRDDTFRVYIPTEESAALIEEVRGGCRRREVFRELGRYSVSLHKSHFGRFFDAGRVEAVADGVFVLNSPDFYSRETGLSLSGDTGLALFV